MASWMIGRSSYAAQSASMNMENTRSGPSTYGDISASGESRLHVGDVYQVYNYEDRPELDPRLFSQMQAWLGGTSMQYIKHLELDMVSGSGAWLLQDKRFVAWQTELNSWLWVYGIPGCGKTVLNAQAIQFLDSQYGSFGDTVIHFYFDFRALHHDVNFMLRSLLLQLSDNSGKTCAPLLRLFNKKCRSGATTPSRNELLKTLHDVLKEREGQVYVVLDALDECDSADGRNLGETLEQMSDWEFPHAHFLITSRRDGVAYSALENIVPIRNRVRVIEQEVNKNIRVWLDGQLSSRGRLGRKLRGWYQQDMFKSRIKTELLGMASGMFLLTKLQVTELEKCHNEHDVEQALNTLPDTVSALYDRILGKIGGARRQQYARDILTWLAFARRELRVEEIEWVIAFSYDDKSEVTVDPKKRMQDGQNEIFEICHSLVGLLGECGSSYADMKLQRIGLAHSTVKDHITSNMQLSTSWLGTIQSEPAHRLITQSLLAYLWHLTLLGRELLRNEIWAKHSSLAWYAVHAWPEHASLCGETSKPFDPTSSVHRQMHRLISNDHALRMLIHLLEPGSPKSFLVAQKLLQDLKLVWCYTCSMQLGRVIDSSAQDMDPSTFDVKTASVAKPSCRISDKLGPIESRSTDPSTNVQEVIPSRYYHTIREILSQPSPWEQDFFLDLDITYLQECKLTSIDLWTDERLAVAVTMLCEDPELGIEAQLPKLRHISLGQKDRQVLAPSTESTRVQNQSFAKPFQPASGFRRGVAFY